MTRPLARKLLLLLTLAVLYGGPVAACVCPDRAMPEMPCCPDQPQNPCDQLLPPHAFDRVCDPAPAQLLSTYAYDLSAPVAITHWTTAPEWRAQAPPPRGSPLRVVLGQRPIYLTTLRLRN
jgi:hypothetical protein